jgi:hypothetical protein
MSKKHQININVSDDVYRWIRSIEMRSGLSKTRIALASMVAFCHLGDAEQNAVTQWANLLDEGQISWQEIQAAADRTQKQRADALRKVVDGILARELEEPPESKPRRA